MQQRTAHAQKSQAAPSYNRPSSTEKVVIMGTTRRDILVGLGAAMLTGPTLGHAAAVSGTRWPANFIWGVATAAHQIEGNNVNSDYWLLEHLPFNKSKDVSGDACDSWHRWREDLALVKALGLSAYRFSIEWARIEPEEGKFSVATLDYYRRLCAGCRELGIMPVVTFHHFTSPRWLAAKGGWENPLAAELFARYCERATRAIGDLIGAACTLNEPNAQVTSYVMRGYKPFEGEALLVEQAGRATGSDRFGAYFLGDSRRVRDVCLAAHARGAQAIKSVAPSLKVGMTLALQELQAGPGGEALYRRVFAEARQPFYEAAAGDDFLGVQPYLRLRTGPDGYLPVEPDATLNRHGLDARPSALGAVIREAHTAARVPLLVSENGIDADDDRQRVAHLRASIDTLQGAVAAGIPLLGYMHWSLLDNYEWSSGYAPKFGLYAVDRTTFVRSPKPSAAVYRALVRAARGRTAAAPPRLL